MPVTKQVNIIGKTRLKLSTAISLNKAGVSKSLSHALIQELTAESRRQLRSQKNIGFFGEDINCRKGIEVTKVHTIHLDYFSWCRGFWYLASLLVLLPLRTNDVLLRENLIYLGDGEVGRVLFLKEVLNLLSAAIIFPLPYLPDPPLYYRVYLPFLPRSFLGLVILIQEAH